VSSETAATVTTTFKPLNLDLNKEPSTTGKRVEKWQEGDIDDMDTVEELYYRFISNFVVKT